MTRTVGRYEIREEIGRGGTATVFLARQTDLRRLVALKELSAFSAADAGFARRFVRESWVLASLSHPSLVTVHEYFEEDGDAFISMEYLPNGSLRSRVGKLSPAGVAGVMEAMLSGLAHAHAHGVVHRDLKPENVLVTAEGTVKIADFGIAKALDSVETSLTLTGTTIGTPTYMAPEQALAGEIGAWTDLYSVGVLAFELIAGRPPFGDAEAVAILMRHVKDPPPRLVDVAPGTDPAISDWVGRLLEKAPEDRPASATEAWQALEEIVLERLGPRWRRGAVLGAAVATEPRRAAARTPTTVAIGAAGAVATSPDPRLAATATPRMVAPPPAEPPPPAAAAAAAASPRRRRRWPVVVAVIAAIWAVAALAMSAGGGGGGNGTRSPAAPAAATATATPAPAAGSAPAPAGTAAPTATAPTPPAALSTPTPAATSTPGPSSGVGDSRSDDPSDDAPNGPEP